ncbi:MAG: twin-arginine translocase TatA/TatE family subunit [Magnetococcus sp. DMHC-6]
MFGIGTSELIIILVIVLIVFGAGKLPKVMRDVGLGVKSFKKAMSDTDPDEIEKSAQSTIEGQVKNENIKNT